MTFARWSGLGFRSSLVFWSAVVTTLSGCDESSSNGPSTDPSIPQKYQAFASAFDQERQQLGVPGAAVAIIERGEVTFSHGFGTKGPNSHEPVDADTLFRIGSMTKALTATTLLGLVDAGAFSLDARLLSVVPDVAINDPDNLSTLTFRQLLSHQSGLFDYLAVDGPKDDGALSHFLTSQDYAANEYFMAPPGSFYNYSNPDYYLAGLALERALGVPYRQAVTDRVLLPLGMTRTFFLPSEVIADGNFMDGKSTNADGSPWVVKPDSYDNAWGRPAGFAYSSVVDYAKFVQFLYAGNAAVLSDAEREEMQSPQVNTLDLGGADTSLKSYGLGLMLLEKFHVGQSAYAMKLVSHGGNIPGFSSMFYLVPETGSAIVWFADADSVAFSTSMVVALNSFAGLANPTAWPPPGIAVDTSLFPAYAGTYDDPHVAGTINVTASGATLSVAFPQFDASNVVYEHKLQPTSKDNFIVTVDGQPYPLTFITDSTGAYVWMRTRLTVGKRVASP